jgi:hypothetical protein
LIDKLPFCNSKSATVGFGVDKQQKHNCERLVRVGRASTTDVIVFTWMFRPFQLLHLAAKGVAWHVGTYRHPRVGIRKASEIILKFEA